MFDTQVAARGGEPAVVADGLGRDFEPRRSGPPHPVITALAALDLTVERGEVFGLLGHNGAGKTTALRLLTGVLRPTRGSARVLGLDPRTEGPALRGRTGVLTETAAVDPRLTGRENLEHYAALYDVPRSRARARSDELLELFELAARADDRAAGYSKGMKRRLALARSLLHDPELLLLDEPTADLDPLARRSVHALIRALADRGRTLLLCTHDLAEAQALCHRVAVLRRGERIALGTPTELAARWGERLTVRLELSTHDRARAQELLEPDHALRETPAGLELVDLPRTEIPELIALLTRADIPLYGVESETPTLEDAYLALHRAGSDPTSTTAAVGVEGAPG